MPLEKADNNLDKIKKNIGHGGFVSGKYKKSVALNENDVKIYSMSKSFFEAKIEDKSSKKTGIIILIMGTLLLVVGFIFVYYFYLKESEVVTPVVKTVVPTSATKVDNGNTNNPDKKEDPPKTEPENNPSNNNEPDKPVDIKPEVNNTNDDAGVDISIGGETPDDTATTTTTATATDPVVVSIPTPVKQKVYVKSTDSDLDGLTDVEEVLFSTLEKVKDSDEDGFDDLAEINALYNPSGTGELITNANIEIYQNSSYGYKIYYPYHWEISDVGDDSSVMFKAPNEQFIQVIIEENTKNQTIEEWYMERYEVSFIKSTQKIYKTGWLGVKSEDGVNVSLLYPKSNYIFTVTYNTGIGSDLYYPNVFDLMVKSLDIE